MTHDMYVRTMVQGSGWATATEIEVASICFDLKINVWFNQAFKYTVHNFTPVPNCGTSIDILLTGSHFSPLKKFHAIENATTDMISPSKNHETPKISSTKRKHNYAFAREANIRIKKQKKSTVKNTIKQVTEKENQNTVYTQPYVDSTEMLDIQTINQTTDINEDTCSQQYMYTAEVYDEQVHGHIFNSVESNCRNNNTSYNHFDSSTRTNNYDPSADSLYLRCRKLGINYEFSKKDENPYNTKNRKSRMNYKIRQQLKHINMPENNIPFAPPLHENAHFNGLHTEL
jgi:hypothetical protein